MIQARRLSFHYGSREIFRDINLDLHPGELVTLLGRNGEGKSTLFKILTGEIRPDSGEVFWNERDIHSMSWKDLARIRSVLPQESSISFPLKVSEVVEMGRAPHKKNKFLDKSYTEKSMRLTDVSHLQNRYYSELSGGEKKRVQIARVLCQLEKETVSTNGEYQSFSNDNSSKDKGFLFLDEPVNALDVLLQHKIMGILRHLADVGYSIFCILHDWNLAGLYSDRVLLLDNGKIKEEGAPEQVIRQDVLQEVFGIHANIYSHGVHRVGGYSEKLV